MTTTMFTATPGATSRVRNPKSKPSPPKNSTAMAMAAIAVGLCKALVEERIVPEQTKSPTQYTTFCAPCAKNTSPSHQTENGCGATVIRHHQCTNHWKARFLGPNPSWTGLVQSPRQDQVGQL